jgi:hypothetical protein
MLCVTNWPFMLIIVMMNVIMLSVIMFRVMSPSITASSRDVDVVFKFYQRIVVVVILRA